MTKIVMVFAAHPDDAEFSAGGLISNLKDEGCQIIIITATDGSKGSFNPPSSALAAQREEEARRGAAVLGAEPPIFLGYTDFELDLLPPDKLREQFTRLIRKFKPDIVIAEDAFSPGEVHPDHRVVAFAASDAINFATLPCLYPQHIQEGLETHFVTEKYYFSDSKQRINKVVDISKNFKRKMAALTEHRSQIEFLVEDIYRQARAAGIKLESILGESAGDPNAAFLWAMEAEARQIGQPAGFAYGEAYRYVRFNPFIEDLLVPSDDLF
jgi:LmbE family N-acetylglucosaminyl deacetylase